jgi:hypothetical protein
MIARVALTLLAFAAACSVVPDRSEPPHVDADVLVVHELAPGRTSVRLPSSGPWLTIRSLEVETSGTVERWRDGARWLEAPPDARELRLRCRYRAWTGVGPDGEPQSARSAHDLFPDATTIQELAK